MKEFSLIVRVPVTYSKDQSQAANVLWNSLLDKWKAAGIYITSFAFPVEGYVVSGPDNTVKKESVLSANLRVVSNIFLRAENFEQAIELAKTFPVLPYGGSVEVREILPRPAANN
ncbi:hypothetical protein WBG78_07710 [Chryseolinea sp. T2]|uniref:hypothetical protein n=1 Tax=Chryseolinea sp. T2 TaxID=3129255 RepID=UPI0030769E9F